ncbi:TetR/AcrR family transcriptional regulator [Microbacterium sp. SSW1-47]|uniref:TetR/AcrR family transcriptional regulator n=1 Tax=Microbacterium TaxID=33882 RepID=UPI00109BE50C|nr:MULTISPECIES: TetR/AcrR family transcriptional regulator [Microbacterium]MBN6190447.1 TetR/AcrR family transcriptional regulator [Aneurinibacillus sp. BA2021]MCK2026689.1 TetR/AcrR family transcriptional regulator [Microbacterium sufflavum]MPS76080.1 TetR/AcrR family transcriptional regulator [Microbacterium sp.]
MPKIVDHDERRDHIADAATQVIIRVGFDKLTMREIATEAGYAHGAIARYFPDKRSVLTAAFLRLYTLANDRIHARIEGVRGLEALERMCREILPYSPNGPLYAKVVIAFWDHASQDEEVTRIHRVNNLHWRDLFRQCLIEARDDGELADHVDIETAVNEIASRNAGWQMISVLMPDSAGDGRLNDALDALLSMLRRPAAPPSR